MPRSSATWCAAVRMVSLPTSGVALLHAPALGGQVAPLAGPREELGQDVGGHPHAPQAPRVAPRPGDVRGLVASAHQLHADAPVEVRLAAVEG